jgi:predicted TIM-barrel fold metal-dependent hydrolase
MAVNSEHRPYKLRSEDTPENGDQQMGTLHSWRKVGQFAALGVPLSLLTIVALLFLTRFGSSPLAVSFSLQTAHAQEAAPRLPPFEFIDAHTHVFIASPLFYQMLQRLKLSVVTICVVDRHYSVRFYKKAAPQLTMAREVFRQSNGHAPWISTFDPRDWERPGFAERVNKQLDQTFRDGAVGVKICKGIGMELKSKAGKYLMPDDPVFEPIFDHIEAQNKTLYAHIAEPMAAWLPLDPSNPDSGFYAEKTQRFWYMYGHPDRPSKAAILAARDHMLQRHPNLRVVGCHLGSMEEDVDDIAKRLDLYPNFVVDTAARVDDLMLQPREKVRAFLIKYQDRVLYGSDLELVPELGKPAEQLPDWEEAYAREWTYYATADTITTNEGRTVQGLALPESVLRKIYHDNAVKWVPGFAPTR